jgi:hypothetical protein
MTTERKPHVHAEVIKAWADGAEVQVSTDGGCTWADAAAPMFSYACLYRIKPEPKEPTTWYQGVFSHPGGWLFIPDRLFRGEDEARSYWSGYAAEEFPLIKLVPIYTEENAE